MIFVKKKTRDKRIPEVVGLELYKLIGELADSDENDLNYYMPVIKKLTEKIEEACGVVCYKGQNKRLESPVLSNMQMGFFCNIFSWIAVCNYKAAWKDFYEFARCDRWPHKGYVLSAQEIVVLKFILSAFEMADKMPCIFSYELLDNDCR